jgi:hypothetical protein
VRCQTAPARDCPTAERCELEGCLQPYNRPGSTAIARERQPIDLPALDDYQPGRIMRAMMALQDMGVVAVKKGPTPFAPGPAPATITYRPEELPTMSISQSTLNPAAEPAPGPKPAAPAPAAAELRVVEVPGPAWLVYVGGKLLGMTTRLERLGPVA